VTVRGGTVIEKLRDCDPKLAYVVAERFLGNFEERE
jgi:hypothetical protein